jgi:hypothetical protein
METTKECFPIIKLCIGKNELKEFSKNDGGNVSFVYLKNDTNFSIELFNPLKEEIMIRLYIGNFVQNSNTFYLKPFERIFVNHLPNFQKFVYKTYDVNSKDMSNVDENLKKLFSSVKALVYKSTTDTYYYPYNFNDWNIKELKTGDCFPPINDVFYTTSTDTAEKIKSYDVNSHCSTASTEASNKDSKTEKIGYIECVNNNNNPNALFNSFYYQKTIHIMPYEEKPLTKKEYYKTCRKYCTNCGTKVKPTYKFCPQCGEKL